MKKLSLPALLLITILLSLNGFEGPDLPAAPDFVLEQGELKKIVVEFKKPLYNGAFGLQVTGEKDYDYGSYYRPHNFDLTAGRLVDRNEGGLSYEAFTLSKPRYAEHVADNVQYYDNWINVVYRFPTREDYTLYTFEGGLLEKLGELKAARISPGEPTLIDDSLINPSRLVKDRTYLFIPSKLDLSGELLLKRGVKGVKLLSNEFGSLLKYSFKIEGQPYDAPLDYPDSPAGWGNNYSPQQAIAGLYNSDGSLDVFWKEMNSSKLYHTAISAGLDYKTRSLPLSLGNLGGLARDEAGNFYYYTYGGADGAVKLAIVKLNPQGKELYRRFLSTAEKDLNIKSLSTGTARLTYGSGLLALMVAKGRHDGHQDGVMALLNAKDGAMISNLGNICSHSFDHRLYYYKGSFISINLGDNYPRGIRIRRSGLDGRSDARLVYTFKTQHSTTAKGNLAAGKWSNDNRTYSELGNVLPSPSGYVVTFSSEMSADNSLARENLNEPRNIGMVLVAENFTEVKQEQYVVNKELVISKGTDSQPFSFYTYGGGLTKQRYVGVVWLTDYKDKKQENASRLQTVKIGENRFLILWERWTESSYSESFYLIIDEMGNKLTPPTSLGGLRLPRGYEALSVEGGALWIMGSKKEGTLSLYHFRPDKGGAEEPGPERDKEEISKEEKKSDYYIAKSSYNPTKSYESYIKSIILPSDALSPSRKFNIRVRVTKDVTLRGWLEQDEKELPGLSLLRKDSGETMDLYTFTVRPYEPGQYHFLIEATRGDGWERVAELPIEVGRPPDNRWLYPEQPSPFGEHNYSLETPLTGIIRAGKTYLFRIEAEKCRAIYLKDQNGKRVKLPRKGNEYELAYKLPLREGRLEIEALFEGEKERKVLYRYWVKEE